MTNPTQLIPAKVRLAIYLAVFLFSVALTAVGQYYTTIEVPIPDVIRGLGGAVAPIAAVFSAVAASNTTEQAPVNEDDTAALEAEYSRIARILGKA